MSSADKCFERVLLENVLPLAGRREIKDVSMHQTPEVRVQRSRIMLYNDLVEWWSVLKAFSPRFHNCFTGFTRRCQIYLRITLRSLRDGKLSPSFYGIHARRRQIAHHNSNPTHNSNTNRRLSELSEQTTLKKTRTTPMGQVTTTSKRDIDKVLRTRDSISFKEYLTVSTHLIVTVSVVIF